MDLEIIVGCYCLDRNYWYSRLKFSTLFVTICFFYRPSLFPFAAFDGQSSYDAYPLRRWHADNFLVE